MRVIRTIATGSIGLAAVLVATAADVGGATAGGQCYLRVATAPVYATRSRPVELRPAARIAHVVPAVVRHVAERVLVTPERVVAHAVPPVFATVPETVEIEPARIEAAMVPPVYRQVAEPVEIAPARREWRVTLVNGREIGCWVVVLPTYATRLSSVLVQPAHRIERRVAPLYATRLRRVAVAPLHIVTRTLPAIYATRLANVVVAPARAVYETVPAVYGTETRRVLVAPGTDGWAPIGHRADCAPGAQAGLE